MTTSLSIGKCFLSRLRIITVWTSVAEHNFAFPLWLVSAEGNHFCPFSFSGFCSRSPPLMGFGISSPPPKLRETKCLTKNTLFDLFLLSFVYALIACLLACLSFLLSSMFIYRVFPFLITNFMFWLLDLSWLFISC